MSVLLSNTSCGIFSDPAKQGSLVYYSTPQHFWGSKKPKSNREGTKYKEEEHLTDVDVAAYARALSEVLKERSRHDYAGQQINSALGDSVNLITGANNLLRLTTNQLGFVGLSGTISKSFRNFLHPLNHPKVYYTAGRRISQEIDKYVEHQGFPTKSYTRNGKILKHNVEVHFHNAYSQVYFDDTPDPNEIELEKYMEPKKG